MQLNDFTRYFLIFEKNISWNCFGTIELLLQKGFGPNFIYDDKCGRRSQFFMLEFWLVKRQTWTLVLFCSTATATPPYNLTNFKWSATEYRQKKVKLFLSGVIYLVQQFKVNFCCQIDLFRFSKKDSSSIDWQWNRQSVKEFSFILKSIKMI